MSALVFLALLLGAGLLAPIFGRDTSDAMNEASRPDQGWYPGVMTL